MSYESSIFQGWQQWPVIENVSVKIGQIWRYKNSELHRIIDIRESLILTENPLNLTVARIPYSRDENGQFQLSEFVCIKENTLEPKTSISRLALINI